MQRHAAWFLALHEMYQAISLTDRGRKMTEVRNDIGENVRLSEEAAASELTEALGALNVTAGLLTVEQERLLDEQGFVFLPGLPEQGAALGDLARRFDELVAFEGDAAGVEVHQEAGTARLANLVDKGSVFDVCWGHPMLLAAVAHVFGWRPFKLNSLNARAALPGCWPPTPSCRFGRPRRSGPVPELQLPYVDAGRTLLSAMGLRALCQDLIAGCAYLPTVCRIRRIPILKKFCCWARRAVASVFNAHLWHGGTKNTTDRPRRSIMGGFVPRRGGPTNRPARIPSSGDAPTHEPSAALSARRVSCPGSAVPAKGTTSLVSGRRPGPGRRPPAEALWSSCSCSTTTDPYWGHRSTHAGSTYSPVRLWPVSSCFRASSLFPRCSPASRPVGSCILSSPAGAGTSVVTAATGWDRLAVEPGRTPQPGALCGHPNRRNAHGRTET